MQITPDFSEAIESSPIPAGVYKVRITGVEQKTSRKGDPYLNWKLTIFGAEGELSSCNNRPVFMVTMLKGPGAGRLKDLAKAALGELPETWDTDQFLGRELEAVLVERRLDDGTVANFPDVKTVRALA